MALLLTTTIEATAKGMRKRLHFPLDAEASHT
jgi:hypothetical protein